MPSRGQNGGAMNDSFAQHSAQTPSPSTGSRQETHSVGSAISSASRAAAAHAPPTASSTPRRRPEMERDGDTSASMTERLTPHGAALKHRIARDRVHGVRTTMAGNQNTAPVLFDRALLRRRLHRARR